MTNATPAKQSTALAVAGSIKSAPLLAQHLEWLSTQGHLVSPAMASARLPEGCEVTTSAVLIDALRETHKVGSMKDGKDFVDLRALGKVALERIASAAGVSWEPGASGRLDDGSDPHYCMWRAVGTIRHFDGSDLVIEGSKEMDMRQGSAQIEALWERYYASHDQWKRSRQGQEPKDPTAQVREMRLHIMAHAETKARLRAIRSGLGLRTYTLQELKLPFVVARLAFTGQSDDPETKRMFAGAIATAFLGGRRSLYGGEGVARPAVRAMAAPAAARLAPPPVGSVGPDDDDDLPDSWNQAPQTTRVEERPAQPAAQPASQPSRQREPGDDDHVEPPQQQQASGFAIPGGQSKGTPIEDASDRDLDYWAGRIAKDLDEGNSRSVKRDQELLNALRMEQEARR